MSTPQTTLTQIELKSAIVRNPLLVPAETTVIEAITQMSGVRTICLTDDIEGYSDNVHQEARSSCVLVVDGSRIIGIMTERDVVRLTAQQRSIDSVTVRDVMASPVITLREADFTDLFSAVNLLQQRRIRHMPILDHEDRLLGIITHESLRQLARPVDLLRLRLVSEVMTAEVIWAEPSSPMLAIAQLMAEHRVGSVLVVKSQIDPAGNLLRSPIGIITERDIVQFQSLELRLDQIEVQAVMSTPVFTVRPDDSLMVVQQIMEQRSIRRLVVTGTRGELLGVVTQTSLLQALNPLELYSLSKILEQKISKLEAEKINLLRNYTADLEQQVEQRTTEIKAQAAREQLVSRISLYIRQSLQLEEILETTVIEVREFLAADRVLIYQFQPDMSGTIVTESVLSGWTVTLDQQIQDTCFQQNAGGDYRSGKTRAIDDIDQAGLTPCHRQLLEQFQVKANLVAPILVRDQLWGLLIAHQCSAPRQWQSVEIELLDQLVVQIAIALQQATAYQQVQTELENRQRIETTLRQSERRYATLTEMSPVGIFQTNAEGHCLYVNERWCQIAGLRPAEAAGFGWVNGMHPDDRDLVSAEWYSSVQANRPFSLEYRFLNAAGQITWVYGQSVSERDEAGEIIGYVGTITDITARKQTEQALLDSEARFRAFMDNSPAAAWITDPQTNRMDYASQSYRRMFQVPPGSIIGLTVDKLYPPDIAQIYIQNTQQVVATGQVLEVVEPGILADGRLGEFLVLKFPLLQSDGRMMVGGVAVDITDRKRAEAERLQAKKLRIELSLLENILDTILAGYWDADLVQGQQYISPGFKRMFGYEDHELPNSPETWKQLIVPEDLPKALDNYSQHVQSHGKIPYYNELRYRHKNGSIVWVICSGRVIQWDEAGNPLRLIGCHVDITDRKRSEERLQLALEAAGDGLWDWNIATDELYLSPQWSKMLGFQPGELPANSSTWRRLVHPEDQPWVMERLNAHFQDPTVPYRFDYRVQCKTGDYCWIANYGKVVLRDLQGKPLRMLGTHRDITASKQVEEQLRESDNHLKTAQRISKLGSWEFDLGTGDIHWSDEVFRIFERDPAREAPSFEELQQLIHPDDRDHHQQVVQAAIETAQPYEIELRFYGADGRLKYSQARGQVVTNATGQITQLIGTILDITERKQAEAELRNLSDRLTLAVKSGAIAIWEWNVVQNILTWDDRMYELYGITPDQFTSVYDAWATSLHPEDRPMAEAAIQKALAGEQDYDIEFRVVHPDGSIRFIKAYAIVQRDPEGNPQSMIGINFDITNRKQAEAQLLQTTAQLQVSNRELEAFAYSVSHDLRSPLRAIDGFSKALLEDYGDQFDQEGKDYFDRIRRNVSRMGTLIDDLLRLSRVSRSEMEYSMVNLSALVREQVNDLQAVEPERQVTTVIAPDVMVLADLTLMRVVISNLIQNAWKFTSHHATARIEFGIVQLEGQSVYFLRDDGAGFDMAYVKMLFGVFQRLHNTHEFPGTGIGLATVQRVIHRHGGEIWAEGAVEQGATIYFTIPHTSLNRVPNTPIRTGD